jgi:hypothetical protein
MPTDLQVMPAVDQSASGLAGLTESFRTPARMAEA